MYCTRKTIVIAMTFLLTAVSVVSVDPLFSDANASIGSDQFCDDNPSHFACDDRVGTVDEDEYEEEKEKENDDWNDSCRDSGYRDGQNGPFSQPTYDHCGDETGGDDAYHNGFIDGCISVQGNTRDVCESATDG